MKAISLKIFLVFCTLAMPVTAYAAEDNVEIIEEVQANKADTGVPADNTSSLAVKYANCETGIYENADDSSKALDYSVINTAFEVVQEENGWSEITTENGAAYIKSCDLSENPVEINNYTDEELYIMAHLLAGECQSYPDEEQLNVGSVVLNRVKNPSYPNTIKGVVFQKGQYSCTWDGNYYREPTERNWSNAKRLLENGSVLPEYVVYQSRAKQGRVYLKTRWHYYCY